MRMRCSRGQRLRRSTGDQAVSTLLVTVLWAVLAGSIAAAQEITDPLPEPVAPGGKRVQLVPLAAPPRSSPTKKPYARLNLLLPMPDGSDRVVVNDMRGPLWIISDDGAVNPQPMLDLSAVVGVDLLATGSEQGFSSYAFHPDFANPGTPGYGKLYTAYSSSNTAADVTFATAFGGVSHHSVVDEWMIDIDAPDQIDTATRRQVLRFAQPFANHNIGQIGFNPNAQAGDADYGKLYVAIADGGAAGDPHDLAQNTLSPLGSLLRIDPLATGPAPYSIPTDNPFAADASYLPELWAYGFRNPHRFSWDAPAPLGTGLMLLSDIGQNDLEEINIVAPGGNYGWSRREGTFTFVGDHVEPLPVGDAALGLTYPIAQYDHDEGDAVVGGFVYRGDALPNLVGHYLFGDIARGRIFYFDMSDIAPDGQTPIHELTLYDGDQPTTLLALLGNDYRADLRFGTDDDGEIYVLTKRDGLIRRMVFIPDAGDFSGDGVITTQDINPFVLALTNPAGYAAAYPDWPLALLDLNGDGHVDTGDIGPFVIALVGSAGAGSGQAAVVPEPAGVLCMLVGTCALGCRRLTLRRA